MATYTITLTEAEMNAVCKWVHLGIEQESEEHDDSMKTRFDALQSVEGKLQDQEWIEEWVAEGAEARPDLSKAVIRKYAKQALKIDKTGGE
tara:strand:- start:4643 stop:4915 length:273 start_codon:yes stop_codon:yes gene_type:complete